MIYIPTMDMDEKNNISIVIPCFNEEKRLKIDEFRSFISSHPEIYFIFVDDGSSDNTVSILENIVGSSQAKIIRLAKNCGKGEAVRQGILSALKSGSLFCGFWDADLATPLSEIPVMISELKKSRFQCIIGSRWLHLGNNCIKRRFYRHIAARFLATGISLYLDLPVYDSQCGAKIFTAEAAAAAFNKPFVSCWLFDVENLKRLQRRYKAQDPSVFEYPVSHWEETAGSKLSVQRVLIDFFKLMRS